MSTSRWYANGPSDSLVRGWPTCVIGLTWRVVVGRGVVEFSGRSYTPPPPPPHLQLCASHRQRKWTYGYEWVGGGPHRLMDQCLLYVCLIINSQTKPSIQEPVGDPQAPTNPNFVNNLQYHHQPIVSPCNQFHIHMPFSHFLPGLHSLLALWKVHKCLDATWWGPI